MQRSIFLTILLSLYLLSVSCESSKKIEKDPFEKLTTLVDQYAENTLEKGNINTIALAIYKDGKVYHNYYGSEGLQADDNTLYELASITKVFLGSLVSKAVLEGKLSLDDAVHNYLGSAYTNLQYEGDPITIKHLLTHTLGLKDKTPKDFAGVREKVSAGDYENKTIDYDMSDLLEELKTAELNKKPGTVYAYNSVGPELLAHILEQVYSKSYEGLLNDFLDELGMKDTYLRYDEKHKQRLSRGYTSEGKLAPISKNPLLGGAAGMIATLPDLMKFMTFQLESDNPLIKEATRELFKDDEDDLTGYLWEGMGTAKEEGFYYSKTGTSNGTQSGLLICPDSNYGLIVIVDSTSEAAYKNWANLYVTKIETDLIKFPKLNLTSLLKPLFLKDRDAGIKEFNRLKEQKDVYFNTNLSYALNVVGYHLMASEETIKKSIELFEFAITKYPENANMYDSLGEAYFKAKDYKSALLNYKKSLAMNPDNGNAKNYILEIDKLMGNQ